MASLTSNAINETTFLVAYRIFAIIESERNNLVNFPLYIGEKLGKSALGDAISDVSI